MHKNLLPVLALVSTLAMVCYLTVPVFADVAPESANTTALQLDISAPAGTYNIGDMIDYVVTVSVPLTSDTGVPAVETNINTTFVDPDGNTQTFPTISSLLPGEFVTFSATGAVYTVYDPEDSFPPTPRADIEAGLAQMPASPVYIIDTTTYAGSYPTLDYTVAAADLVPNAGYYAVTATADTGNVGGSEDNASQNDSASANATFTSQVSLGQ